MEMTRHNRSAVSPLAVALLLGAGSCRPLFQSGSESGRLCRQRNQDPPDKLDPLKCGTTRVSVG